MKTCSLCLIEKPVVAFALHGGNGRHSWCKACVKIYDKERYTKIDKTARLKRNTERKLETRKIFFEWIQGKRCLICLEADIVVLEFDHRNPKEKKFDVGVAIGQGFSWKTILKEIDKCDILCANCHRRKTSKQRNWYKDVQRSVMSPADGSAWNGKVVGSIPTTPTIL